MSISQDHVPSDLQLQDCLLPLMPVPPVLPKPASGFHLSIRGMLSLPRPSRSVIRPEHLSTVTNFGSSSALLKCYCYLSENCDISSSQALHGGQERASLPRRKSQPAWIAQTVRNKTKKTEMKSQHTSPLLPGAPSYSSCLSMMRIII